MPAQGAEGAGHPAGCCPHRAASGPAAGGATHSAAVRGEPAAEGGASQLGPGEGGTQTCSRGEESKLCLLSDSYMCCVNVLYIFYIFFSIFSIKTKAACKCHIKKSVYF